MLRRKETPYLSFMDPVMAEERLLRISKEEEAAIHRKELTMLQVWRHVYYNAAMKQSVADILGYEYELSAAAVQILMEKLADNEDILYEMYHTLLDGEYPEKPVVTVNGKCARDLKEGTSVAGSYIRLIMAREEGEEQ